MSNHTRRPATPAHWLPHDHCSDPDGHSLQRFLLDAAAIAGTLDDYFVCVERNPDGNILGYWRIMRCGCTWLALPYAPEATRSAAQGRQS